MQIFYVKLNLYYSKQIIYNEVTLQFVLISVNEMYMQIISLFQRHMHGC